jgi:O-methyltransferase
MSLRGRVLQSIRRVEHRQQRRLFDKYAERTMVPRDQFVDNLLVSRLVDDVPGAVVECGTWRGGMIAALAETLSGGAAREFVLFDSFQGLPPAGVIDGEAARAWQADPEAPDNRDNCRAAREEASESMRMAGVDATFVEGWFDETVPTYAAAERPAIALLRLDADWYDSTMVCLRHLFPLVVPGGIVIIDDYGVGVFDGCTRAVHDFLSEFEAREFLRTTQRGVTFIVRR